MRRTLFVVASAGIAGALFGCGNNPGGTDSGATDSGTTTDAGSADAGKTPIVTVKTGTALPAPWSSANIADFNADGGGAAAPYFGALVQYSLSTTTQGQYADGGTCPAALSGSGYCDGFQANVAAGGSLLVDVYSFAGTPTACASQDNGVSLPTIRGIWYIDSGAYAIAITGCSDIGIGTPYAGIATAPSTPAGSQTVAAFNASNPADGAAVTVSGIVIAVQPADSAGEFSFAIEDPNGGVNSATAIYRSSTSTAPAPNIGDYVTVSGSWSKQYANISL